MKIFYKKENSMFNSALIYEYLVWGQYQGTEFRKISSSDLSES